MKKKHFNLTDVNCSFNQFMYSIALKAIAEREIIPLFIIRSDAQIWVAKKLFWNYIQHQLDVFEKWLFTSFALVNSNKRFFEHFFTIF